MTFVNEFVEIISKYYLYLTKYDEREHLLDDIHLAKFDRYQSRQRFLMIRMKYLK